jgi:hypothetical protein
MTLTRERIESMAPDQPSLAAALKLVKPANWPVLAATADASLMWGECQGSGATPYRVVVSPEDTGYKCTCPSRKFPCKHVLAVLWIRVDKPERFEEATAPAWVEEWSARRRPGGGAGGGRPTGKPKPDDDTPRAAPSLQAALDGEPTEVAAADPKAAARAEAQRQRVKAGREAAVLGGLDDLEHWLRDQLGQGMAGFAPRSQAAVRTLSTRLVDAKAGGLAARLDRLVSELFRVPEEQRADLAIERLAALTLIAAAYRHQDRLSPPLREDVRRAVGWTQRREELLADPTAPRLATTWIVAANLSEVQPDKLRRLETWLVNAVPGTASDPHVAVLVDFVPVSGGAFGFAFEPGEQIEGDVVFYPSAAPLRGLLATRKQAVAVPWPRATTAGLAPALADFAARLGALPWLDVWPLMLRDVTIRQSGTDTLVIADADGPALPLERSQTDAVRPMLGLEGLQLLCSWDGRTARLLAADTPIGQWHEA